MVHTLVFRNCEIDNLLVRIEAMFFGSGAADTLNFKLLSHVCKEKSEKKELKLKTMIKTYCKLYFPFSLRNRCVSLKQNESISTETFDLSFTLLNSSDILYNTNHIN